MQYRAEIDGLRALAVVPVILFHAGIEWFSGGFVGVDIFFVISGYLITTILIEDLQKQRFSLLNFYERRARRILPVLFFVILCCLPFAWTWMAPSSLKDFSQSLVAVSLFASNFLFWIKTDYFATSSEEMPLLHTWSLAVEEQYYLLFPIFLLLTWRFGKQRIFWVIVGLAVLSIAFSEGEGRKDPSANFYLPFTRSWELFAGSIAALIVEKRGVVKSEWLSLMGLAMIIFSIFVYDDSIRFPSFYALLPVVGVVLLILFADKETLSAKLLSYKIFVGIGLISYSAYLWHQPMFAFARLKLSDEPTHLLMLVLSGFTLLLAFLSWKFIEQPFRNKQGLFGSRSAIFTFSIAGLVLIGGTGVAGQIFNGFDYRLTQSQREVLAFEEYPRQTVYREGQCFLTEEQGFPKFQNECIGSGKKLLWGDSHAAALASGWLPNDKSLTQFTASKCPPFIDVEIPSRPYCLNINRRVLNFIKANPTYDVYLHAYWSEYQQIGLAPLSKTIQLLKQAGVTNITIIGGVPHFYPTLPRRLMANNTELSGTHQIRADTKKVAAIDSNLHQLSLTEDTAFINVLSKLCNLETCDAIIQSKNGFVPIAWDETHFTQEGAEYVYKKIISNE